MSIEDGLERFGVASPHKAELDGANVSQIEKCLVGTGLVSEWKVNAIPPTISHLYGDMWVFHILQQEQLWVKMLSKPCLFFYVGHALKWVGL